MNNAGGVVNSELTQVSLAVDSWELVVHAISHMMDPGGEERVTARFYTHCSARARMPVPEERIRGGDQSQEPEPEPE